MGVPRLGTSAQLSFVITGLELGPAGLKLDAIRSVPTEHPR